MKPVSTTIIALLVSAPAAVAADIVVAPPSQPVADVKSAISWTGFYVGGEGGYGWLAGKIPESLVTAGATEAASGGTAGVFLGYDHQFQNNMVVGLAASYGYNWNDNSYTVSSPLPILDGQTVTFGTQWHASVEGRVGYAFGRALLFASGGYAATRLEGDFSLTGQSYDDVLNGWTAGLGLDYAFTEQVFGRLKASYSDYRNTDLVRNATGLAALSDTKVTQANISAGIGFRF